MKKIMIGLAVIISIGAWVFTVTNVFSKSSDNTRYMQTELELHGLPIYHLYDPDDDSEDCDNAQYYSVYSNTDYDINTSVYVRGFKLEGSNYQCRYVSNFYIKIEDLSDESFLAGQYKDLEYISVRTYTDYYFTSWTSLEQTFGDYQTVVLDSDFYVLSTSNMNIKEFEYNLRLLHTAVTETFSESCPVDINITWDDLVNHDLYSHFEYFDKNYNRGEIGFFDEDCDFRFNVQPSTYNGCTLSEHTYDKYEEGLTCQYED